MGRISRYSPEVRERAVRMVVEHQGEHPSQGAVIGARSRRRSGARRRPCGSGCAESRDAGRRPGLTSQEAERLKALERENRELRRANEILRKASAFFAQAELDRRPR